MKQRFRKSKSLCSILLSLAMVLSLVTTAMISVLALEAPTEPIYQNYFETLENTEVIHTGSATDDQQFATISGGGLKLWRADGAASVIALDKNMTPVADGTISVKFDGAWCGAGILFRYVDENNYLRLTSGWNCNEVYLEEVVNGVAKSLWNISSANFKDATDVTMSVVFNGQTIGVYINGQELLTRTFDENLDPSRDCVNTLTGPGYYAVIRNRDTSINRTAVIENVTVTSGDYTYANNFTSADGLVFFGTENSAHGTADILGGGMYMWRVDTHGDVIAVDKNVDAFADGSASVKFAGDWYGSGIVFRYADPQNFLCLVTAWNGAGMYLQMFKDGVGTNVYNFSETMTPGAEVKVVYSGETVAIFVNGNQINAGRETYSGILTGAGYCGAVRKLDTGANANSLVVEKLSIATGETTYTNTFTSGKGMELIGADREWLGMVRFNANSGLNLNKENGSDGAVILLDKAAPQIADGVIKVQYNGNAYGTGIVFRYKDLQNYACAWLDWSSGYIYVTDVNNGNVRHVRNGIGHPMGVVTNGELKVVLQGSSYEVIWNGYSVTSGDDLTVIDGGYVGMINDQLNTNALVNNMGVADISCLTVIGEAPAPVLPEEPTADYTASLGTTYQEVAEGQDVTFTVTVDNAFASGEVTLTFDPAVLSFESTTAKASQLADGTLKLATYGADGQTTIEVVFTAVAVADSTTVTLTKAAFSTAEKAETEDLTAAEIGTAAASVAVIADTYVVTLGDNLATLDGKTGAITVANGTALSFKVADAYTALYTDIVVKAGDEVLTAVEGVYTIDHAAAVTVTGTPKTFGVTVNGDDNTLVTVAPAAPVYGTDFVVTLPDNKQASLTEDGYTYSAKITIGGVDYAVVTEKVTTIAGDKVTGDVVITVTKTPVTKTGVTITVTGETSVAGDYATVATKGEAYTLTITPAAGYAYTVTAQVNGVAVELTKAGNAYTVAAADVTGDITFEITATVVTEGLSINKYLALDGTNMWLVKMVGDLAEDKVYKYGDTVMVWSDNYDAYVCLVISAETPDLDLAIVDGDVATIAYTNDINGTTVVDANDAQFVYNMYMAMYNDFTTVSMEKFLLADVNADSIVDVADAAAIVAAILA